MSERRRHRGPRRFAVGAALLLALAWPGVAGAVTEAPPASADPALEARMMAVATELRCLVCQNQTIADLHAGLAVDLRQQIREQLAKGRSEREILDYMSARYGDFVLYRPPFRPGTALLWLGPFALMALALGRAAAAAGRARRRPPRRCPERSTPARRPVAVTGASAWFQRRSCSGSGAGSASNALSGRRCRRRNVKASAPAPASTISSGPAHSSAVTGLTGGR